MTSGLKQKYSLNFVLRASICHSFFFLNFGTHTSSIPPPPAVASCSAPPFALLVLLLDARGPGGGGVRGGGRRDLAHAPPPI